MTHLRRYFVAGLLFWVPVAVTILIISFLVDLLDRSMLLVPLKYRPEALFGFSIPGLGVLFAVLLVFITGVVVANLLGRRLLQFWEALMSRIPFVRSIYATAKQVMETVVSGNGKSFREVVMLEYPRKGLWTLAFVTGDGLPAAQEITGETLLNIFVPTTPNPTSGFFLMVADSDVVHLDLSVEDGLKLILSTGVILPPTSADKLEQIAQKKQLSE
ncbi:MAG: DUF502 domain-containing protein [Acidiferrobacterales bacterium]|nr:DUF502 domain-containing protein [Acidiferrobacterales bacterium]